MSSFVEPFFVVYDVDNLEAIKAAVALRTCIGKADPDDALVQQAMAQRTQRIELWNQGSSQVVRIPRNSCLTMT